MAVVSAPIGRASAPVGHAGGMVVAPWLVPMSVTPEARK